VRLCVGVGRAKVAAGQSQRMRGRAKKRRGKTLRGIAVRCGPHRACPHGDAHFLNKGNRGG